MMRSTPTTVAFTVLTLAALTACEEEGINRYTAPADPPRVVDAAPMAGGAMDGPIPAAPPGDLTLAWTVPAGWTVCQNPPGFVIIAYDDPSHTVQTTISRLAGAGGGALPNINRWRGQIGLPPVGSLPEQPMERIDTAAGEAAGMVDLMGEAGADGQPARILAAILPRQDAASASASGGGEPSGGETWFFKMSGPRDRVEAEKRAFVELVASATPVDSPIPGAIDAVEGDE